MIIEVTSQTIIKFFLSLIYATFLAVRVIVCEMKKIVQTQNFNYELVKFVTRVIAMSESLFMGDHLVFRISIFGYKNSLSVVFLTETAL